MLKLLARIFGLVLLAACSSACVSHKGPESVVWLVYEQADQSSRYVMTVQTTRTVYVSSEGALAGDRRPVAQDSRDELSVEEQRALADLFTPDLISVYESNSQLNLRTEYAVDRTFVVHLDSRVPDSPVSRSVTLGMTGSVDANTQTMLDELNKMLVAVWNRGKRSGPNPGVPEPWQQ